MMNDREITKAPENPTMVYLAHPYGGKPENAASAARIRTRLQTAQPAVTIFSPVEHFSPLEGLVREPEILRHCITALARCDALWAAPGHEGSKGCTLEIAYAYAHGIPVLYLGADDE